VPVLKTIETLQDNREPWVQKARESTAQGKDVWCTFAKESYSADRRMCVIALQTAVAESYFDRAKRWSKEMPNHLSNNEKAIIDNLDAWLSTKRDWASTDTKKSITDLSPSNRIEVILGELEASVGRQVAALKQLKESLREHREEGRDLKGET
jgi:hypothetical protein